ncbi:Trm112 family protein [Aestuariibacter halophilus]|uniref:UPF0434 protein LJ739_03720 n=1 Tax=Fluctibacter halophilus TaxID=226011 RepID=A0ABS8G416_9ALTE|nr:Trm112 family protein [Aestuariibacter halophilus]MCC2615344.1 Trm112 family protein [Aestuariibacter halophilus]
MAFDNKLLDVIACPACKGELQYLKQHNELLCRFDRLVYPIRDNIPVLLQNEATELSSEEMEARSK